GAGAGTGAEGLRLAGAGAGGSGAAMTDLLTAKDRYVEHWPRFEAELNGQRRSPLHAVRAAAIERFAELGFPTTRNEEWKYTSVAPIAPTPFALACPASHPADLALTIDDFAAHLDTGSSAGLLVFVNGFYAPAFSSVPALPGAVR